MDPERFKNITAGVQSVVLSIAVIAGGFWSYYTFGGLRSIEEARAKLESLTASSLSITIDTERTKIRPNHRIGLIVRVSIENMGGQKMFFDLSGRDTDSPLEVVLVETGNDGQLHAKKSYRPIYYADIFEKSHGVIAIQEIQIKSKKTLNYFVEVETPGVYFIRFRVPGEKLEEQLLNQHGIKSGEISQKGGAPFKGDFWGATTFVDLR